MKKISGILGLVVSIAITICGISTFLSADEFFIMSGTKFGADFYTEIFEEVEQVKASARSIDNAIYESCGLLLISIGSISFCAFFNVISNLSNMNSKKSKDEVTKNIECTNEKIETV